MKFAIAVGELMMGCVEFENPNPVKYRLTEVCFVVGGEVGFPGLIPKRRSLLRALRARRRGRRSYEVEPLMTREMVDELVRDSEDDDDVRLRWEGDELVITDVSDESWIGNALVKVPRSDADRPTRRLKPNRHGLYDVASFERIGNIGWSFSEFIPPWPAGDLDGETILALMAAPSPNWVPLQNRITARAHIDDLARALQLTTDARTRKQLCYAIQKREQGDSSRALPDLLPLLRHPDGDIRTEAADAIFSIAHGETPVTVFAVAPDVGEILLSVLVDEDGAYARELLADALGELHYEPAVPILIEMLDDEGERIRRVAAWALGEMRAVEAASALRRALSSEEDELAATRMREALAAIDTTPGVA